MKIDNNRYDNNIIIVSIITQIINKYPMLRFQQILQSIGVTNAEGEDLFYEESSTTLNKILKSQLGSNIFNDGINKFLQSE